MENVKIIHGEVSKAISVMKEVAAWGREKGLRIWKEEWITREELLTEDARPEDFCVGMIGEEEACSFILQRRDREFWNDAPENEAVYLHKFCVCRKFAHKDMTLKVVEAIRKECVQKNVKYIRLDTGLDEKEVRQIYLRAGFKIVKIIDYPNGRSIALYEFEV